MSTEEEINLLDELDIGDEDTDFGRGYARAQRDLGAAGWLPPDEAERLKADFDQLAVALTVSIDNARAAGEDIDKAEAQLEFLESQLAVLLPVIKLLWPEGGAKRVPFDRVSQLPEAVEWLLQQRVLLTELLDKAERERDQAIAHDRQPYPTAEAYERACAALRHHRAEAERLKWEIELRLARQREELLTVPGEDATGMSDVEIAIRRRLVEAEAVIRRASDAVPGDSEAWWLLDDYDGSMSSVYALAQERDEARAERAAVQPVIDAARKMIAKRDQKYGPNRGDPAWWSGHDFEWDLVKAIDALDADSPPEGPRQ